MKKLIAIPMLTMVMASPLAMAQAPKENGVYIGAGYGLYKLKDADDFDDDSDAISAVIGFKANPYLAVEGGYVDFGDYGGNLASASTDGMSLALKASLPFAERFAVYGKIGQLWWETDYDVLGIRGDTDGSELFYGIGASFAASERVFFDLDYTRYTVEFEESEVGLFANGDFESDIDHASLGVRFLF